MTSKALVPALALCLFGCDSIMARFRPDPIVGTWRHVEDATGATETYGADGSYRSNPGAIDPEVTPNTRAFLQAMSTVPARYSRGGDTIVVSYDVKAIRKAMSHMPQTGPDRMKGDALDVVCTIKLSGDILETTCDGKTAKSVRVR